MGTHGRNAITIDSEHICCEQSLDGHNAQKDFNKFMFEIFDPKKPSIINPSMEDQTDECDHLDNFAHIDYDRKIFYTGFPCHPKKLANMEEKQFEIEYNRDEIEYRFYKNQCKLIWIQNTNNLEKHGWTLLFDVDKCPKEYGCVNSIEKSIEEFIKESYKAELKDFNKDS